MRLQKRHASHASQVAVLPSENMSFVCFHLDGFRPTCMRETYPSSAAKNRENHPVAAFGSIQLSTPSAQFSCARNLGRPST